MDRRLGVGERGNIGMILVPRQLQEKCRELHKNLCMSIELSSAFHTVNRHTYAVEDAAKDGCPLKFTALIYTDMKVARRLMAKRLAYFLSSLVSSRAALLHLYCLIHKLAGATILSGRGF